MWPICVAIFGVDAGLEARSEIGLKFVACFRLRHRGKIIFVMDYTQRDRTRAIRPGPTMNRQSALNHCAQHAPAISNGGRISPAAPANWRYPTKSPEWYARLKLIDRWYLRSTGLILFSLQLIGGFGGWVWRVECWPRRLYCDVQVGRRMCSQL